jgi:menaquinone-dependent protoporphyrinogen oxidase
MGRWHKDAGKFVRRHARALRERQVWLFGSGPLDLSAEQKPLAQVSGTDAIVPAVDQIEARGYIVFGGRLSSDARGFPASAMAKKMAGDYRNEARVRTWADGIAAAVAAATVPT